MKIVEERNGSKMTHEFEEMTPEKRPQDPCCDGTGLVFETLEHGGEYPDTMPQAIRVTDAEGRSCIYVPITVDGKVVDSKGFSLEPAAVDHTDEGGRGFA
jgi:protocatechuate 3,4-dioxygenase beta subunit